jgi:hypothetical protein
MRFAYADPPYIGQAKKHYGKVGGSEVDHQELIGQLETYDGWALSLSSSTLQHILAMCPKDVRIAAWVKPFCSFKPGVNPAYAWEPVIWKSTRARVREQVTVRDWIAEPITLQKGLAGAKPITFCYWLFELLNIQSGDTLDDLFPGTRAVSVAFEQWTRGLWMNCEVSA